MAAPYPNYVAYRTAAELHLLGRGHRPSSLSSWTRNIGRISNLVDFTVPTKGTLLARRHNFTILKPILLSKTKSMHTPRQADFGNMQTRTLPRHCLSVHYVPLGARRNLRLVEIRTLKSLRS